MKKQNAPQEATIFKFKFTPIMLLLAYAVLVLCAIGIGLSIWRISRDGIHGFGDILKSPFLIAVCLFCMILVVAMLIRSQYVVTDEFFITQFGFIKSKFAIKTFTSITLDTDTRKLTIYMGEEFFVTTTRPEWNNDLVQAIRKVNPDVEFSFTLTQGDKKNQK